MFEFIQNLQETSGEVPQAEDLIIAITSRTVMIRDGRLPCWNEAAGLWKNQPEFMLLGTLKGKRCFAAELKENHL